jgi:hypothetical protein
MTDPCENRRSEAVAAHGAKYVSTALVFPFDDIGSCTCIGFEVDDSERCLVGRPPDIAGPLAAPEGRLSIGQQSHGRLSNNSEVQGKAIVPAFKRETSSRFWKQLMKRKQATNPIDCLSMRI